jgi:hypothetical protein
MRTSLVRQVVFGLVTCVVLSAFGGCASHERNEPASGASMNKAPAAGNGRASVATGKFNIAGTYVETCSCAPPCPCELVGLEMGCQGVGAVEVKTGTYGGADISGVRIATATEPGKWVRIYIDAPPSQQAAAESFARAAYGPFGAIKSVKTAAVEITGTQGKYTVNVDRGKIMTFRVEPILGGDGKNPIVISNVKNQLTSTFYQGQCVAATFHDGDSQFTLAKGRNAYFNDHMTQRGEM